MGDLDIQDLRVAGRILLPRVAGVYARDHTDLHDTACSAAAAFTRLDGSTGTVYEPWRALRDAIELLFRDTAFALEQAGLALDLIATDHAVVEERTTARFQALLDGLTAPGPLLPHSPGEVRGPADSVETSPA
jgi:hypothetical protein